MKKLMALSIIFILVFSMFGCLENNVITTKTNNPKSSEAATTEEQSVDLDYGYLLESIWEKYLISAFWNDALDIDSVDEIIILGIYTYNKHLGEYHDRFYIGDERTAYSFYIIITFDEESVNKIHRYSYNYSDIMFLGERYIESYSTLDIIDSSLTLDDCILSTKADLLETKQTQDEYLVTLMNNESVFESELIEDRFKVEDIAHYMPIILDIIISNSIIYMIGEEEVSVVGYKTDETYPDLQIASEIDEKPVTKIYEGAFLNAEINSLEISVSIKEIGYRSFGYSIILNFIFTQDSHLKKIEEKAFYGAFFREIIIPISVEEIESNAFEDNSNMCMIYVEASEKPAGWSDYWIDDHQVEWGYIE